MSTNQKPSESPEEFRTRRVNEWYVGFRIVAPIVLLLVLFLGNAQWMQRGMDMAETQDPQAQAAPQAPEYFPAQYTNQAQTVEPDAPTF